MKGDNSPSINGDVIENFYFPIPSLSYQRSVVELLYNLIPHLQSIEASKNQLAKYVESAKQKLLEEIFSDNSSYKSYYENDYKIGDILEYVQPGPYIVHNTNYDDSYNTPVLTPGKTFILGYTNEKNGIYHADQKDKVIIFDDFTTATRLVNFDFKVKSSAMKILKNTNPSKFDIEYMFYLLQTIKINNDSHKRFWISEYAPKIVKIHTLNDQKNIVALIHKTFKLLDSIQ